MNENLSRRLNRIQKQAVKRAERLLNEEGRCLIIMTTGTGKTRVGAKIIKQYPKDRVLWLTQTEELIAQSRRDLQAVFGEGAVGIFQRSERSLSERIIVASLQTIEKHEYLKTIPRHHFGLVVVDEAHHAPASTWSKVIQYFKCKRLGLTATPERTDGVDLFQLFGNAAFQLNYEDAKRLRLISEEIYRVILTNSKINGVVTSTGEYKPRELDRLVVSQDRNHIIVDSYKKYGRKFMREEGLPYKAICFCITVDHAVRMRDLFRKENVSAEILVSKHNRYTASLERQNPMTEKFRKEVWGKFLGTTETEVLCVVDVLNEGKNIPDVGCLMMARPTRSAIIFQQQMGRGCRRIDGKKEKFVVLDFVDLMNQKYAPMTLSKLVGRRYDPSQVILDYYRGKDPIVVNEYIEYLSRDYSYHAEPKWTKAKASQALITFYQERGHISPKDLVTWKTGLPNRTTICRYWKTVKHCFKELRLGGLKESRRWTKVEAETAILKFYQKHGDMGVLDLGSKNGLPSKRVVNELWGGWRECAEALNIRQFWTKERVLSSMSVFFHRRGRMPKKSEMTSTYNLPPITVVKSIFGGLTSAKVQVIESSRGL